MPSSVQFAVIGLIIMLIGAMFILPRFATGADPSPETASNCNSDQYAAQNETAAGVLQCVPFQRLLCSTSLVSAQASITCSALKDRSAYRIVAYVPACSAACILEIQINSDSTSGHYAYATCIASSVTCTTSTSAAFIQLETAGIQLAGRTVSCDLFNPAAPTGALTTSSCVVGKTGANVPNNDSGSWCNTIASCTTAQITSITLLASTGNLNGGTTLLVYG